MHNDQLRQSLKFPRDKLKFTDISKLLMLPSGYNIFKHEDTIQKILTENYIFHSLTSLEMEIQPILEHVQSTGLIISNSWFSTGLQEKKAKLNHLVQKLNQMIGSDELKYKKESVREFWRVNSMPVVFDSKQLSNFELIHPTYKVVSEINKIQNYLKQWDERLKTIGTNNEQGLLIKGSWTSFSSYSGRMTAKKLPLTSLPRKLRQYIIAPKGYEILSLDLNAAELRFLAYFSKCENMLKTFKNGEDIHTNISQMLLGEISSRDRISKTHDRDFSKEFIFSYLYGVNRQKMVGKLRSISPNVTTLDVINLEEKFNNHYPEISKYLLEFERSKYLYTPLGKTKPVANFKRNQKRNFLFQASVAYAVKHLMLIASSYYEVIHVQHDEIWLLALSRAPTATTIEEITYLFNNKLQELFTGFPVNNLLTLNSIGGLQ
ncbi:MAG: DNA polymerase [Aerococcus urinaeequi]|nr:DNA polymerase [Aerococcus urinaeequi]